MFNSASLSKRASQFTSPQLTPVLCAVEKWRPKKIFTFEWELLDDDEVMKDVPPHHASKYRHNITRAKAGLIDITSVCLAAHGGDSPTHFSLRLGYLTVAATCLRGRFHTGFREVRWVTDRARRERIDVTDITNCSVSLHIFHHSLDAMFVGKTTGDPLRRESDSFSGHLAPFCAISFGRVQRLGLR